jgi:uncharacterized membrane protein YadS
MDLLLILAVEEHVPWAALGGFLLGVGSALSGYAAIISARNAIKKEKEKCKDDTPTDDIGSNQSR